MKKLLTSLAFVLLGNVALATDGETTILNSDLSAENQVQVAIGVQSACGYFKDLSQASPTIVTVEHQEVGDVFLKIHLTGLKRYEQFMYDEYNIYVDAVIPAVHQNGPALLQVQTVLCEMK